MTDFQGFRDRQRSSSPREPRHAGDHATPAQKAHDCGDICVVIQNAQVGENGVNIVFDKIRVTRCD